MLPVTRTRHPESIPPLRPKIRIFAGKYFNISQESISCPLLSFLLPCFKIQAMHFQKQDLTGTEYHWEDGEELFSGEPTRRLFDRFNGHQVLFIINSYVAQADKFTTEEGRFLEDQIANQLPTDNKSEISVFNWIKDVASTLQN